MSLSGQWTHGIGVLHLEKTPGLSQTKQRLNTTTPVPFGEEPATRRIPRFPPRQKKGRRRLFPNVEGCHSTFGQGGDLFKPWDCSQNGWLPFAGWATFGFPLVAKAFFRKAAGVGICVDGGGQPFGGLKPESGHANELIPTCLLSAPRLPSRALSSSSVV